MAVRVAAIWASPALPKRESQCGALQRLSRRGRSTCGPMRIARHNGLPDIYADMVEEIGGVARREVYVPEFSQRRPVSTCGRTVTRNSQTRCWTLPCGTQAPRATNLKLLAEVATPPPEERRTKPTDILVLGGGVSGQSLTKLGDD